MQPTIISQAAEKKKAAEVGVRRLERSRSVGSGFDRVAALAVFALAGRDGKTHLLA